MRIHISPSDGVPIYMQIVQQVRMLVAAGELKEGDELPSIRALAERLVVNPNTIARAYRDLEAAGVVTFSRGLGTFVAAADPEVRSVGKQAILTERIDALIQESRQLGVPFDELLDLIHQRIAASKPADERELSHGK